MELQLVKSLDKPWGWKINQKSELFKRWIYTRFLDQEFFDLVWFFHAKFSHDMPLEKALFSYFDAFFPACVQKTRWQFVSSC